jgi:hypothetical protein
MWGLCRGLNATPCKDDGKEVSRQECKAPSHFCISVTGLMCAREKPGHLHRSPHPTQGFAKPWLFLQIVSARLFSGIPGLKRKALQIQTAGLRVLAGQ